ncbi:MAG: type II toxin-antitoxin system VapC family toxin [Polyangiaceae bacterium]
MISVDTNVLVRVLVNDDADQAKRALRRLRSDSAWISRTVLLEAEWVLRHAYGLGVTPIQTAFQTLLGVASVEIEDRDDVLRALGWHAQGMDFADALHLAASNSATHFVTFDRKLAKAAKRVGAKPPTAAP